MQIRKDNSLLSSQYLSELSYHRLVVIISFFFMAFFALASRLLHLVIIDNDENIHLTAVESFFKPRKEIVDRNGELLAVNLSTASLYAKPKYIFEPDEVAKKLKTIFPNLDVSELKKNFKSKKKFLWIKRNISPQEQYAVNNLGVPGLNFEKGQKRVYLHGNILSHVLGYVDVDGNGIAGAEKYFNNFLLQDNKESKEGEKNLQLSIDIRVQTVLHDVLMQAMAQYKADGISGVVMDANNGEIYAMVSLPDFNPNFINFDNKESLFNRATLGIFELGSIFKAATMAMALDCNAVSLNDVYYVGEPIKASRFKIHDYKKVRDWMTVPEIFMYSSNIGTARISLEVGTELQKKYLKRFGLFDKLSVEVPEKGLPMYPLDRSWNQISTMTISYGHGIAISPLHFTQLFAALVNGGYLYPATILKNKNENLPQIEQVISNSASEKMRRLLRLVVEKGTGKKANVPGYFVGGKTGSADKSVKGGYSTNSKISSFVSAFPMHDPKFVVLVMLDAPKSAAKYLTTGGRAVAPITYDIISRIGPMLKVIPRDDNDEEIKKKLYIEFSTENEELMES